MVPPTEILRGLARQPWIKQDSFNDSIPSWITKPTSSWSDSTRLSFPGFEALDCSSEQKKNNVTPRLVKHNHEQMSHQGRGMTRYNLQRHGFWIICYGPEVARHISKCVICGRPVKTSWSNREQSPPNGGEPKLPFHVSSANAEPIVNGKVQRLAPTTTFHSPDLYLRERWHQVQHLANEFCTGWRKDFPHSLQTRQKWIRALRILQASDGIFIYDDIALWNVWEIVPA